MRIPVFPVPSITEDCFDEELGWRIISFYTEMNRDGHDGRMYTELRIEDDRDGKVDFFWNKEENLWVFWNKEENFGTT